MIKSVAAVKSAVISVFLISFLMAGTAHASYGPEIAFANQIIQEIKDLKTETNSVGISPDHASRLVNRLNTAKYFVKKGRTKLENNKPFKAKVNFWIAKFYTTRYIRLLKRKVRKGHVSAATADLLLPDARLIRKHLKQLIRGEIGNGAPVAAAGMDQSTLLGQVVTLDGSGSSDPDGDSLTFQWTLVSQPGGSSALLAGDQSVTPTLSPDLAGSYVIELVVSDAEFSSSPDSVTVNVSLPNTAPVADAGPDQTGVVGDLITLDGSGSSDADGDSLNISWNLITRPVGSVAVLDSASAVMPTFTADLAGLYQAELVVNDGSVDSSADVVAINIDSANTPPVANAGPDQSVFTGEIVQLDGSQSSDVDGDPLTWFWSITIAPAGSAAALSDEFAVNPTFTADLTGQYVIQLEVDDSEANSTPDSVIVNAVTPNTIPVAAAGDDQSDFVGSTVTLDGSGSSDADNDPLNYNWSLISTPSSSAAALDNPAIVSPSFVLDVPGNYVAQLVVNDGQANSAPDETVVSTLNSRPVANAGNDQTIVIGGAIQLDGTGSSDADNDPLTYQWSVTGQPEGSSASLSSTTSSTPSIAPDEIGFYVFQLIVNDGNLDSDPVSVTLQVDPLNNIDIILDAPADGLVTNQAVINFIGSLNHTGTMTINGANVIIETDMSFDYPVTLIEGINIFNLAAVDAVGTQASLSRQVTLDTSIPPAPALGFIIVSLPDTSNLVTITGQAGSVEAFSEVVIVNTRTGEVTIVVADANGAFMVQLNGIQGDTYQILSQDVAGNQSESIEIDDGSLPDDPADVAPTLNPTQITSLFDGTSFLYSGADPIQTGVAPGTIDPARTAVIRGRVLGRDNVPLPGVSVTIKDHPEFGQTLTRNDGMYDLAVNGGERFVVSYAKDSYLPIQRKVQTGVQDYFWLDDAVMIQLDPQVTTVDLLSTLPIQVAQGSIENDLDGSRQASLMFKQGTSAVMTLPDNTTQTLDSISVRATEYTVGDNGPASMPAPLPATSGYTYAVEFSVDEALAVNAKSVSFNQPVAVYLENFIGLTSGVRVAVGYYDFEQAAWIGSDDGRIVTVTAINGGIAEIDIDGDDVADDAATLATLGIDQAEQEQLALRYNAGQSLWRVPVTHFSPWDFNFPAGPQQEAKPYAEKIEEPDQPKTENGDCNEGCIIGATKQTLGEFEPIAGTDLDLFYQSYYTKGYVASNSLSIPVTSATPPSGLQSVRIDIDIAGARTTVEFDNSPNQEYLFVWDGKDGYGREVRGNAVASVFVQYVYPIVYYRSRANFSQAWSNFGSGVAFGGGRAEGSFNYGARFSYNLGPAGVPSAGLGGWTLSNHHAYDAFEQSLYMGTGEEIRSDRISDTLELVAGGGSDPIVDNVDPKTANLFFESKITNASDGGYYISGVNRIRKVTAEGLIYTIAGNGGASYSSDGGLAVDAQIDMAPDAPVREDDAGNLYFADTSNRVIRKIDSNGIITTIAGVNNAPGLVLDGDGGSAIDATLYRPKALDIRSDGAIIFGDNLLNQGDVIRIIHPNGIIERFAGTGSPAYSGDGGLAAEASVSGVSDLLIDSQDNVLLVSHSSVRRIDASGVIERIAGRGSILPASGVPALDTLFNSSIGLALDKQDRLYISQFRGPSQIFRVDNGVLEVLAGVTDIDSPSHAAGDIALTTHIGFPTSLVVRPDQSVFYNSSSAFGKVVYRIKPAFPAGFQDGSYNIAARDGQSIYQFDAAGRHLRTLNSITATVIDEFAYTPDGLLDKVTDAFGNETTIQRDANGAPLSITSPYGQVTSFTLDSNGYLQSIANPLGDSIDMVYDANGLMTNFADKNDNPSVYTYEPDGRLKTDINPIGGGWTLDRTEIDDNNYKITMTTAEGRIKKYAIGDPTEELNTFSLTNADGSTHSNERTLDGRLVEQLADGTQVDTQHAVDPRFGMQSQFAGTTSTQTPAGLSLNQSFDRNVVLSDSDNPLSLTSITETDSINGRDSTNTYDATTQIWTQTSPENRTSTVQINPQGQPVLSQITGFNSANYGYDTRGRLEIITEGSGVDARVTTLAFYQTGSQAGFLESITDAENQVTRFEYDALGRVTKQILPDLREVGYSYDDNGNLASLTPPGRPAHAFVYDGVDQEKQYTPPAVTGITTPQTVYNYNLDKQSTSVVRPDQQQITMGYGATTGLLDSMTIPVGSYGYSYDSVSALLTGITAPGNEGLSYAYDGPLLKNSIATGTVNGSVDRAYDTDFRIASRSVNDGNTINFAYDDDSLLTQAGSLAISRETQKAGLISGTSLGSLTTSRTYNDFAEMDGFEASYGGNSLFNASYTRDKLGRIETKTETVEGVTTVTNYVYDLAGRLESETIDGVNLNYTYDDNGNRTHLNGTPVGTYDDQDRLNAYEGTSYFYTDNGELQSKTEAGAITSYQYDVIGNLRHVTLPDGMEIDYVIDGQNRRVGKRVDGVLTQGFLYKDQFNPVAELDGDNNILSRFIYGTKSNVPDYMVRSGITYRIISDHIGSPRLVVNIANGAIAQRISYDTWGNITQNSNPGFQPFGFAGGIYDSHTQLIRFGARDYDSRLARWTSKDPIQFGGKDNNLYGYGFRDPVNFIDISGFEGICATCVSTGPGTAPGSNTPYDSSGQKWCKYTCINEGVQKEITAPGGSFGFCRGQEGGDEYSKLKFNNFKHDTDSMWDDLWHPEFSDALEDAFSKSK